MKNILDFKIVGHVKMAKRPMSDIAIQMAWIAPIALLCILRDLLGVAMPDILISGLCAVIFIATDIGTSLGVYIFTTALTLPHNEIRIFYLVAIVLKLLIKKKFKFNSALLMTTVGMILIQTIDTAMFSNVGTVSYIYDLIVRVLSIIIPVFWFSMDFKPMDLKKGLLCYAIGVVLGSFIVLVLTANKDGWDALLAGEAAHRLGGTVDETTTAMQTTYNANQIAIMCAIATSIMFIFIDKKWAPAIPCFAIMGYLLFIILLTRSRTGIFMFALAALMYFWVLIVKRKKIALGILILALTALIVAIVISAFPQIVEKVLERFIDQDDITSGRDDLFVAYIDAWSSDLWCGLFGYGVGTYLSVVGIWNSPHNSIADILICWGAVGLVLILITLCKFAYRSFLTLDKKESVLAFAPAIIAIVSSMAAQYLTTGSPHARLCFLLLAAMALAKDQTDIADTEVPTDE